MENIQELLDLHKKWLSDCPTGKKLDLSGTNLSGANLSGTNLKFANLKFANLSGANLSGANLKFANLSDADLRYCIGNTREVKSLQIGTYLISYTKDILNIGCQSHTLDKWKNFLDDDILYMDGERALEWWRLNKDIIITLVSREQL